MSSTEDPRLSRFFDRRLVPLAERLRARGHRAFALGPDERSPSYYVAPDPGEPFLELDDAEACERALRELWQRRGLPELAALAGPLLELARKLEVREDDSGEVSPFVYVMY
jgi:hypothetical protein